MSASTTEELLQRYQGHIVPQSFNAGFITLSYVVSLIGAASTLEVLNRRTSPKGIFNHLLLVTSAVTMGGIAIWCMHFIGNRAIDLADGEFEMQIAYSSGFTALSFFVPIIVLLAAFVAVGTNNTVSWWRVTIGGVLAGAAICGMHYLGNNSIENYVCIYNPVNVVGAALIAVAASIVALALFFVFRAAWTNAWWKRSVCAIVLAGAVSGMHWCAAKGTEYQLVRLNNGTNELSRNTTVIVVICLSVGACFLMAGTAMYSARIMRRYASKAQQVVLAAAVFDKHGRILVSPDGLVPSEKITDTFFEKNSNDNFSVAHPLFHWMFQASRNWAGISTLVGGMANHVSHLPRTGRDRDNRDAVQLISEHGEMVENYDVIIRELFCVAAVGLAEKMKEHLTSVGMLWDEILPTGAGGERPGAEIRKRQREVDSILHADVNGRKADPFIQSDDLAEKGIQPRRHHEYGRGSLMFLVRKVENDREVARLEAAGYRFAELRQVSGIIGSSMQIKARDFESKLRNMAAYADDRGQLEPGVHLGFFGIRARVGSFGFDVLVRQGARNLLPSLQMPIARLESWHMDLLRQLDRMTVASMSRKLDSLKKLTAREMVFASQLFDTLEALRSWIDDPVFDDAILTSKIVTIPARDSADDNGVRDEARTLIAFRLVIPIHVHVSSRTCEFIPLGFFKVHQLVGQGASQNMAFAQSVHRELAPLIQSVPLEKPKPTAQHRRRNSLRRSRIPSRLRNLGRSRTSYPVDVDGNPIPTVLGRSSSPTTSNQSSSTLKLWHGRRSSGPNSPSSVVSDGDHHQTTTFGGIMVSEEIRVEIHDAVDMPNSPTSLGSHRRTPTILAQRVVQASRGDTDDNMGHTATTAENRRTNASGTAAIEMRNLADVGGNIHSGRGTQTSNVEAERANAVVTFVDELFTICIDSR